MSDRGIMRRASWSLVDQGIVSLGNFAVTVLLARGIPSADYGVYALFLSVNFAFQLALNALVLYPYTINRQASDLADPQRLLTSTFVGIGGLTVLFGALLAAGLAATGYGNLLPWAVIAYAAWQLNEAVRRCLHAEFRFRETIYGDAVGYICTGVLVALFSRAGTLTLFSAFEAMTIGFGLGFIIHFAHTRPVRMGFAEIAATLRASFKLGKWALLNEQIGYFRLQVVPWTLVVLHGPAAVASYQAALNLANLVNPLIIGLSGTVPQAVAEAEEHDGSASALNTAAKYIAIGAVPLAVYAAIALSVPTWLLEVLYGAASPYADLGAHVQILIIAWIALYFSQTMIGTLFGLKALRYASIVNAAAFVVVLCALVLIGPLGALGACIAVAAANLARVPLAAYAILRTVNERTDAPAHDEVASLESEVQS